MVKLICFEWRKHFLRKPLIAALLLFSILNILKIGSVYVENSLLAMPGCPEWKGLYWELYTEYGGTMSAEKIGRLMDIYRPLEAKTSDLTASTATDEPGTYTGNIYNDYHFFSKCYIKPMRYAWLYRDKAAKVAVAAKENMEFYKNRDNRYELKKNTMIADLYTGRQISGFQYIEMYQYYLHYDFSSLLVLLLCLYGVVGVFVLEKETDMETILLTAKRGGRRSTAAKILASILFIMAVCVWFWILDFVSFAVWFGSLEGAASPLYSLENFEYAGVELTLGQYSIVSAAVKTAGILILCLLALLLSSFFQNALVPFLLGMTCGTGLIVLAGRYMGSGYLWAKVVNPFMLVLNRGLFRKTEYVSLGVLPLPVYVPALFAAALWALLLISAIFVSVRKNKRSGRGGKVHGSAAL